MLSKFKDEEKRFVKYHTLQLTKLTYFVSVPIILFSIMMFLSFVKITIPNVMAPTSLSWFILGLLIIYYFFLNIRLAIIAGLCLIAMNFLADLICTQGPINGRFELCFLLFIFGWLIELSGYFYERKHPSLIYNITHVAIAPLFFVAEFFFYFNMMNDVYIEIYGVDKKFKEAIKQHENTSHE